ncbi:hypothetical protein C6A37_07400, partial [Desulfobacteraceae bacterium SEEP-SAG9]
NDCEMQHNAEVGLFTKPSSFSRLESDTRRRGAFYRYRDSNAFDLYNRMVLLDIYKNLRQIYQCLTNLHE